MSFKNIFVIFLSVMVSSAVTAQEYVNDAALESEALRFTAMIKKDSSFLAANLDEELVYVHSNGLLQDKKDFINSIMEGRLIYQSIEFSERKLRKYNNTAIINGVVHVKGILNGTAFEVDLRYTDVMVKRKEWQLVNWQSLKMNQ